MTIRQFAGLCGCNPQTLRYYDHVDLLKPARVDQWSGYRYYDEDQALDYVKIKNLQTAGFSIEEIKALLEKDNSAVREAFDAKIAEQEERLQEIKRIRRTYQTEMTQFQEKIYKVKAMITRIMKQYDAEAEFGIDEAQYEAIVDRVTSAFDQALPEEASECDPDCLTEAQLAQQKASSAAIQDSPEYESVYERHGWQHAKEFLDDVSVLEDGAEYRLKFRLGHPNETESIALMNTMLNILLLRNPGKQISLACDAETATDGCNHFILLKKG